MIQDNRQNTEPISSGQKIHTLSILSGKGGVGKSNIAAALSFALADFGRRVVLIDADLGMANLDILCGVDNVHFNISDLGDGTCSLREILVHFRTSQRAASLNGAVTLLPGGVGLRKIADLDAPNLDMLLGTLSELDYLADYIIMDAGAGVHRGVLPFAYASEITLLVTTPEPTSMRDAYGLIKSLGNVAWNSFDEITTRLMLVVNMVDSSQEGANVAERILRTAKQFLGYAPTYLGYVLRDDTIERSVKARKIFYKSDPNASASICIRNLAGELLRQCDGLNIARETISRKDGGGRGGVKSFFRKLIQRM